MDADTEAAGYGESVEAAEAHMVELRARLVDCWDLILTLNSVADLSLIKSKSKRKAVREAVALVEQRMSTATTIDRLERMVRLKEKILHLRRIIRTREKRGQDASGPRRTLRNKLEKLHELESG